MSICRKFVAQRIDFHLFDPELDYPRYVIEKLACSHSAVFKIQTGYNHVWTNITLQLSCHDCQTTDY